MTTGATVVRVLGPVDVLTSQGPVSVGGHHQRALLGALAIGAGHAVPVDHLLEVIWGDQPPRSAPRTLQSYVSHLREVVGGRAIAMVDHSYELSLDEVDVDAHRFEGLVHEAEARRGDTAATLDRTREALELWRGPPFGELADEEAFVLEAYRLDELRMNAVELHLAAELAEGGSELVVGELEAAVKEYPYRERLWRLLVEALTRAERRVEALRACAELRTLLAEVGVPPSRWIADAEQAILATPSDDG